ncbi:tryptophan--tRNA ligase [Thermovenabulum gondwanense]|uniref:Tryptophan--tRNA ligase n=1 Tax=Thermovenabulum gondwanense TaxID=520767 RepID=A0A162M8T5_9FIRM|nr:tryptophan--tRNA ligase [Thermovenabulum gondwanense]KYO64552.1 Tryptophan--tRNA ligase [Thermovenabulum gondwanense]
MSKNHRIMSGMRPTAKLHLGNMMGALMNWVKLQDEYECFYSIVDWHALTTGYNDTSGLKGYIREMVIDWLSVGLDPEKCNIFVQSQIKEHAELHLLLSMITPLSWLERCPTYKEQLRQLEGREINTYGFLGYPVLMTADILAYKADLVPVGEDQAPHLELAREIVRRFNYLYKPVFPEPEALYTEAKVLPGIDGRKMSKSYDNYIAISATPEEIRQKVMMMVTDPARIKKSDPGHPEICTVYAFNKVFAEEERVKELEESCKNAKIGCVECKKRLADLLVKFMEPIRERRISLEKNPELVNDILNTGAKKAREVASKTLEEVREAMKI